VTHGNTQQHAATNRNTLQHLLSSLTTSIIMSSMQHTAPHCNTPQLAWYAPTSITHPLATLFKSTNYTCVHINICIYTHIYMHTYIYIYIYIHIYKCQNKLKRASTASVSSHGIFPSFSQILPIFPHPDFFLSSGYFPLFFVAISRQTSARPKLLRGAIVSYVV